MVRNPTSCSLDDQLLRRELTGWASRGIVYVPDETIPWMAGGAGAFFPLPEKGDLVKVFLTGRDKTIRSRIGVVTLRWAARPAVLDVTREPVFDLGECGAFDMDGVSYPWIVDTGGSLLMFYVGWNRLSGDVPFRNQIGLAVSEDGGNSFRRVSRAPLLPLNDMEPYGSGSCCVERVAGGWRMYYTNFLRWERRPDGVRHYYHVREAYSKDAIHWERPGKVVLELEPPDEYALGAPDIGAGIGTRVLHFTARGQRYRLFAAVETSAGDWVRLPGHVEIARSSLDSEMQCYPRKLQVSGRTFLLFSGNGYGRAGISYAEWSGV